MKIAVAASRDGMDAEVDPYFGICRYFIIADKDTMEFESVDNSDIMNVGSDGVSKSKMVIKRGAKAVLAGNCGPKAYKVLAKAGVEVITGISGRVRDAVQDYKSGKFQPSSKNNVDEHYGKSFLSGKGMGRGLGKGLGEGLGRCRRQETGVIEGMITQVEPKGGKSCSDWGVEELKDKAMMIKQKLSEIESRIKELETRGNKDIDN